MIDTEAFKGDKNREIERLSKRSKAAVAKLNLQMDHEIDDIKARYAKEIRSQETGYGKLVTATEEAYYQRVSGEMVHALREDHKAIQERSPILSLSEDAIEKVRPILAFSARQDSDSSRAELRNIVKLLDFKVAEALELLLKGEPVRRDITTYIGIHHSVYIIAPLFLEDIEQEGLGRSFSEAIKLIADRNRVEGGRYRVRDHKLQEVDGSTIRTINFRSGSDIKNEFVVYTLTPTAKEDTTDLGKIICQMIQELQPNGFSKAGLEHVAQIIEPEVATYFMNHTLDEMSSLIDTLTKIGKTEKVISYEDATNLLVKPQKILKCLVTKGFIEGTDSGIVIESLIAYYQSKRKKKRDHQKNIQLGKEYSYTPFTSPDPANVKEEALSRLREEFEPGSTLTQAAFRYIVGIKTSGGSTIALQKEDMKPFLVRKSKRLDISYEGVEHFINSRRYVGNKWRE